MMNVSTSARGRVVVLSLALIGLSGCTGPSELAVGSASSTSPSSSSPAASSTSASSTPSPVALTLGDDGIGGLGLGMTKAQAVASGMLGAALPGQATGQCATFHGKRGVNLVSFVDGKVRIISVKKSIRMANGLGVGDTYAQLHRLYPEAYASPEPGGRLYLPAPGAKIPAEYRIGIDTGASFPDSKIIEITLQGKPNGCYE
jgi:hypothetical protein